MIVVAPGANRRLRAQDVTIGDPDAVICQLEIPLEAVQAAAERASFFCLNAAPARGELPLTPDLLVVNQYEYDALGRPGGLIALTRGAEGAVLLLDGDEVARAVPPRVQAVDGTAAGDAFTAALVVGLVQGRDRRRGARARLRCGCARRVTCWRAAVAADRCRARSRMSRSFQAGAR